MLILRHFGLSSLRDRTRRWARFVNPVEIAAWLHGKFFTSMPWMGYLLVCAVTTTAAFLLWMSGVERYNEQQAAKKNTPPVIAHAGPPSPPSTNVTPVAPRERIASASTPPSAPPPQEPPVTKKRENSQTQTTSGDNSPIVSQGPGSIAQIGNNNQASIVNHPPTGWRMLSTDELSALAQTMKLYPGQRLHIKIANIDTNSQQMAMQIVGAARAAGWTATLENYMAWGDPEKEPPTGMN